MEDHASDQQEQEADEKLQDVLPTIYQTVGDNMMSSKLMVSGLRVIDKKCLQQLERGQVQKHLNKKDNDSLRSCGSPEINSHDAEVALEHVDRVNNDDDDDDGDVVMGQLRNGCDKTSLDQKQGILNIPEQLESISLNQASSDETSKEYVPVKSAGNSKNCVNFSTNMKSKIFISPTTTSTSSTESSIAGQNTTKSCDDSDKCKLDKDNLKDPCGMKIQRQDENITSQCLGGNGSEEGEGTLRGKNIAKCIGNISTDTVQVSNSNTCMVVTNNQMTLRHARQSPYITVQPLHACNTSNHFHNNQNHLHIQHHHHNHMYQSEHESENFANELTNALSSRLLFQITNNSSYCTNSAPKSQSKRQSSFLKSQSLEIVQDSPSILYSYHETDDDENVFFQLPEIDEQNLQHKHQNLKDIRHSNEHQHQRSNIKDDRDDTRTVTTDANEVDIILKNGKEKNDNDSGVAITRSLSLAAQKTGVALKTQSLESRPIYPNVPYSPYASPYSSPRSNRRRPPLRESRRVSIEQSGSFLQLNQYKLMDQIGQGSYGLVKLAYSEEDSTHYAMKILSKRRLLRQAGLMKRGPKKSTSPLDRVYREIAVLKKLDHPNVVKLVEVLDDPVEDSLYMVFELVKQGEVLSVPTKNPLSEERAWSVFRDTLLGLEYLHYQRIIHADIKPGNLLLTECGRVKIADLGVCNEFIGENATMTNGSTAGTPAFRAPESLNVGQNIYCGKAADIWALGATLYALVYGNVPFVASSIPVLYEKIKHDELSFPEEPKTSAELRDCIQCMLRKDPSDRITLPQLKEHIWVTAGGLHPLPSEEENCRLVQVNDDDINSVVRSIPKLDTLILIKTMLKKHSFGNPFSRGISGRAPQRGGSRLERFIRAGRSNSAPGSYNMIVDRQLSGDNILPALCEHSPSNCTIEESQ